MISEVKYSQFAETNEEKHSIDMDEFIALYANHRPVFDSQNQRSQMRLMSSPEALMGRVASLKLTSPSSKRLCSTEAKEWTRES